MIRFMAQGPLKRYLQKNVETIAAKVILEGNVDMGDTICFYVDGDRLAAKVEKNNK